MSCATGIAMYLKWTAGDPANGPLIATAVTLLPPGL
jgi:hypothetical protein